MRLRKQKRLARAMAWEVKRDRPDATDDEIAQEVRERMRNEHGLAIDLAGIFKLIQLLLEIFKGTK